MPIFCRFSCVESTPGSDRECSRFATLERAGIETYRSTAADQIRSIGGKVSRYLSCHPSRTLWNFIYNFSQKKLVTSRTWPPHEFCTHCFIDWESSATGFNFQLSNWATYQWDHFRWKWHLHRSTLAAMQSLHSIVILNDSWFLIPFFWMQESAA